MLAVLPQVSITLYTCAAPICLIRFTVMSISPDLPAPSARRLPAPGAVLQLVKPVTWFPPMWAYLCGGVSAGVAPTGQWSLVILGVILAGPVVCGMSQAANDWCDRHVDAINEPDRPIPSGRIPGTGPIRPSHCARNALAYGGRACVASPMKRSLGSRGLRFCLRVRLRCP